MQRGHCLAIMLVVFLSQAGQAADKQPARKSYRIAAADLKDRVIWDSTSTAPDGSILSFGGQDQESDDGIAHTRFRPAGGEWIDLYKPLLKADPLQNVANGLRQAQQGWKTAASFARSAYFEQDSAATLRVFNAEKQAADKLVLRIVEAIVETLKRLPNEAITQQRGSRAIDLLNLATDESNQISTRLKTLHAVSGDTLTRLLRIERFVQRAADALAVEPPARALSPIVFEPRTGLFVLFGGDHCDYLTCGTWVFDPLGRHWQPRAVAFAPPPRAGHTWKSLGNGKLAMSGGYTYTSSTDYCGSQYAEMDDGEWTYDVETNKWTGADEDKLVQSSLRTYRTGPFDPQFYWQDPQPDADEFASFLKAVPKNTWTQTKPPHLPQLNRDWGTAVYDPQHDLILRFSGGHSAHGGTDVLQYHCRTNRWELCFPVEFPLGQLYSNTSYPEGFNFNRRPWVTGHTYQSYGYDSKSRRMIFNGQRKHAYFYDPVIGDWDGRVAKPEGMNYDSCFYTLTTCATPAGLVCWTNQGKLFRFDSEAKAWRELELHGAKLPGSEVDNSTLLHDTERDRLLFARKPYGEPPYDGVLHSVDLKTLEVARLEPAGLAAADKISYLCQLRYDRANDLVLCGCTPPPDGSGVRRTPAYDCANNRWVSLAIGGDDPSGPKGRNVSLGLMYDARRGLFWAVDTNSHVYVLRLDPKAADLQPLQ